MRGDQDNLYWQEDEEPEVAVRSESVVDAAFRIDCSHLPADHAHLLFEAIKASLPWFGGDARAGIHAIHGAETGNGWVRPGEAEVIYLSRRVRLILRVPRDRIESCRGLTGQTLAIDSASIRLGEAKFRELTPAGTLFARRVLSGPDEDESVFLDRVDAGLATLGVTAPKRLPGRTRNIRTPQGTVHTRSLLLADLKAADSIRIQESGIGELRSLGCGLFVPHKSISAVNRASES